jgi:serine/threonine protein kinase
MFKLIVTAGPDKGLAASLKPGESLQIGRSQSAGTRLSDPAVSRIHCEIEAGADQAVLRNISTNGTLVNGETASEHVLAHGDLIRLGNSEMQFVAAEPDEAPTAMLPSKTPKAAAPQAAPQPATAAGDLAGLPGKMLSHYQIDSVIARGTSGTVFKARDTDDGQTVALKVLQPEFSRNEEEMQRFVRAMKTMLPVRHPNIVQILSAGRTGAWCWIAMEHVEGESLTRVIQRIGVAGMLDWKHAYRVAVHIGQALDYAHGQSIIHRNVTPANILLRTSDKAAKLGDLMLAKALEGVMAKDVTKPGELVGDVAYMAPERTTSAAQVDGRSDLYGLGATLYALLTGKPPFAGNSLPDLIRKIRSAEPEKPKKYQLSIPDMFQGTVLKLLAKQPAERFQSAAELLDDLKRVGRFSGVSA